MDRLEHIVLSEISQTEKDTNYMVLLTVEYENKSKQKRNKHRNRDQRDGGSG